MIRRQRVVEAIHFDTADPAFAGEMLMELELQPQGKYTLVIISFHNMASGIRAEDNEAGTRDALAKLARYVEARVVS